MSKNFTEYEVSKALLVAIDESGIDTGSAVRALISIAGFVMTRAIDATDATTKKKLKAVDLSFDLMYQEIEFGRDSAMQIINKQ